MYIDNNILKNYTYRAAQIQFLTTDDGDLVTTDELDRYGYGKNDG